MKYAAISNNLNPALFLTHDIGGAAIGRRTPQLFRPQRPDGVDYELHKLAQAPHDWHTEEHFCISASEWTLTRIIHRVVCDTFGETAAAGILNNYKAACKAHNNLAELLASLPCTEADAARFDWPDRPVPPPPEPHAPDGEVSPAHTAILGDDGQLDQSDQT